MFSVLATEDAEFEAAMDQLNAELQANPEAAEGLAAVFAGLLAFAAVIGVCALIWYIIQIIAYWKIFTKAGEAGWKSIIPLYNLYTQFKFSWKTMYFWVFLALSVVGGVLMSFANVPALPIIGLILYIAALVIAIASMHFLSKAFGHGVGFTLGLIFLEPIFMLILGFSKDPYVGNKSEG